jgi:polyferredoxin
LQKLVKYLVFSHIDQVISAIAIAAILTTAALLSAVQIFVGYPRMLLLDRFVAGGGWIEVALLSIYAGFIAKKLSDPNNVRIWRVRIWRLFSLVFFAQFIIGLAGVERFLMTGKLHLPIPALIAAGPIYRGSVGFMLILFLCTILLVGPAWCSHLCYIGAWDDWAARRRKKPAALPRWRVPVRIGIAVLVLLTALLLSLLGVSAAVAGGIAIAFGLGGVALMVFWSRKTGAMTHCVTWCPISLFTNYLGKISPFRLRIGPECNDCGICTRACRFDALNEADIKHRRPGITCTLCGECVSTCKPKQITYWLPGFGPRHARAVFIVIIVALHAAFLGVARM